MIMAHLTIASKNTDEQIQQYREDQKAAACYCARCGLRKMMTIDELMAYTEACKKCRK